MSSKYLVIVGDGMADLPHEQLNGQTVIEASFMPNSDKIASFVCGLTSTVPDGMNPGSDTANLSIFSYNPAQYYTGRAPLEALNLGIDLGPNDMAFRMNFVSIVQNRMDDFTADHIDSKYGKLIVDRLKKLNYPDIEFYAGVSYRNIMVWRNYPHDEIPLTVPPHDIQTMDVSSYLASGSGADLLSEIACEARLVIADVASEDHGLGGNPTDIWLWGAGKKPALKRFSEKYSISGVTVSAVDLIHGIGRAAGLNPVAVDGATGYLDTNYKGKVDAALNAFETHDFVYLHIEAPDETGHEGSLEKKRQAVEDFDLKVVGPMLEGMKKFNDYTILLMPDHPTPVSVRTHTSDPVPFAFISTEPQFEDIHRKFSASGYSEKEAKNTGLFVKDASMLLDIIIKKKFSSIM
ncbi:MAG: cofactor-independent phosphoglycerate mutase [Spirochaetes bacterium]|nr:cofactor-independent phosphoglycerate mutase [Spirochaetota bacterium]MBN2769659.1 cofactor-independent phosphoglycerate mutase [Spirochaetota bacterium]